MFEVAEGGAVNRGWRGDDVAKADPLFLKEGPCEFMKITPFGNEDTQTLDRQGSPSFVQTGLTLMFLSSLSP